MPARRLAGRRTQSEIHEQTTLGAAYVRSLMRSQLRTGLAAFAVLALPVTTLPLFFGALRDATVVWAVLGFGCYPFLVLIAWAYVRRAERNERDFARLVRGTEHQGEHAGEHAGEQPGRPQGDRHGDPRDRHGDPVGRQGGAHGERGGLPGQGGPGPRGTP